MSGLGFFRICLTLFRLGDRMKNVMLDLETMGAGPRAAIVAIGAIEFDIDAGTVGERFYRTVDLASSVNAGAEIDASTVLWWMKQSDEARAALAKDGVELSKALMDFSMWLHSRAAFADLCVWGNGASFDNVILASAYQMAKIEKPWRFWNDRCYRTIRAQHPDITMERIGVHHNAADDAESQARHLIAILKNGN